MGYDKLDNLVKIGKLHAGEATRAEVDTLIKRGLKKLQDAKREDLGPEYWRVLDDAHRDRNIAEYEGDIIIDEQLIAAMIRVADVVAERVQALVASSMGEPRV